MSLLVKSLILGKVRAVINFKGHRTGIFYFSGAVFCDIPGIWRGSSKTGLPSLSKPLADFLIRLTFVFFGSDFLGGGSRVLRFRPLFPLTGLSFVETSLTFAARLKRTTLSPESFGFFRFLKFNGKKTWPRYLILKINLLVIA